MATETDHRDTPIESVDQRFRLPVLSHASARTIGRICVWVTWTVVVVAAVKMVFFRHDTVRATPVRAVGVWQPSVALNAFAVGFTRAYLTVGVGEHAMEHRARSLQEFTDKPEQMDLDAGKRSMDVVWAEPVDADQLGKRGAYITVRAGVRMTHPSQTVVRYLTVPVQQTANGAFVVFDQPSFTAAQQRGRNTGEFANDDGGSSFASDGERDEIAGLVDRFFQAYLSGGDIEYLLPSGGSLPGAAGNLSLDQIENIQRVGVDQNGLLRVRVQARVVDTDSETVFPMHYLLGLLHKDRWYVASIAG